MNRAIPEELAESTEYDSNRYVELLADNCATVLASFGVSKEVLLSRGESLLAWVQKTLIQPDAQEEIRL